MNKLGFYTQNFAHIVEPLQRIKPRVLLAEMNDRGALRSLRNSWSLDTFVVGRFHFSHPAQAAALNDPDPAKVGREMAERFIQEDFRFATQQGVNERLFVDAWMTLNEVVRGPASFPEDEAQWTDEDRRNHRKMEEHAKAYDTLQVAFLERMRDEGLEAVAFNFAAGNWTKGEDYIRYFSETLENYTYLGFHEYGWPHMDSRQPDTKSGCGIYREVMEVIRDQFGDRHKVIITEAGLARMYKIQDEAGDVGWLYRKEISPGIFEEQEVSEESYKSSLRWYNEFLAQDDYVLGACLFMVGVGVADWETFAHVRDEHGNTFTLMDELESLEEAPPFAVPALAEAMPTLTTAAMVAAIPRRLALQVPRLQGDDVRELQDRLASLRYLKAEDVNGSFDETTDAAVRAFQGTNGLIIDGIVGSQTRTALASNEALPLQPRPHLGHLKVGLDLNRPISLADGAIEGPSAVPAVLADTGTHWTRLNFILGPWRSPDDTTPHSGKTWVETYQLIIQGLIDAWDGDGPQIYGLIGAEAVHPDPRNLFRYPPLDELRGSHNQPANRQKIERYVQDQIAAVGMTPGEWIQQYTRNFEMIVQACRDRIHIFETFNEPDDWHTFPPQDATDAFGKPWKQAWIHPTWLAHMLQSIYQRVKPHGVKIIASPLQGLFPDPTGPVAYLDDVYKAGKRRFGWRDDTYPFDGVAHHIYAHEHFDPDQNRVTANITQTYNHHLNCLEGVIKHHEGQHSNKKLYISEFGCPTPHADSEAEQDFQAHLMRTGFDVLKNDPRVDLAMWFSTQDFDPPEKYYGLYKRGALGPGAQKKALETFRACASAN